VTQAGNTRSAAGHPARENLDEDDQVAGDHA
jgi:hypothetical protein